jgi:O-antigen/teichoic acid export membrane protein
LKEVQTKSFSSSFLTYALGIFLSRGISFLLVPIYISYIEVEDFGALELTLQVINFIVLLGAFEIIQGVTRFYYDKKSNQDLIASTAFYFALSMHLIIAFLLFYFAEFFSNILFGTLKYIYLVRTFSIISVFAFLNSFTSSTLIVQRRAKEFSFGNITYAAVSSISSIIFVAQLGLGLQGILFGLFCGYFFASMINLFFLKSILKIQFSVNYLKQMLAFSLPLLISSFSVFLNLYFDRVIISKFLDLKQLGFYSMGYKVALLAGVIFSLFKTTTTPFIFENYKKKFLKISLNNILKVYVIIASSLLLGSFMFSEEIIYLISDSRFRPSIVLVPLFVASFSLSGAIIFFPGFGIARKSSQIALISAITCFVNIFLNIILIQKFGVIGSVFSSLVSNLFLVLSYFLFSKKYFDINYNVKLIKTSLLLIGYLCLACLISETEYITLKKIFIKFLALISFSSVLVFIQFRMDEIKTIYRKAL